ncbi:N-acetylmuramoyl-L-alanine amidase [Actinomadura rubteroloni]|uniref:N-acetylmuramoyl-L-alanine amidase n=1 Tax=Actinomadura rubteroloni TaxID=1926885 RepID=A0A2P4UMR2_9ACTN|nr:peptidoglycan recognition family protein [Actinomadura rubteroloni]POM26336.1 N-acetylmuramoyl-L-alanine amidase [Actinomadura rubteroloni]
MEFTRRVLLGGLAAVPFGLGGGTAAAARRPEVAARERWGAVPATSAIRVLDRAPDRIVVHHTGGANATDVSVEHAYELSRSIQRFHMEGRGWSDIGEQLTISRGGQVMEGRTGSLASIASGRLTVGAQVLGHNEHTLGIENEGTYMDVDVPDPLWASLAETCAWLCAAYDLDPGDAIVGHRDFNSTDCPGDVLYARLPELRQEVGALLGRRVRAVRRTRVAGRHGTFRRD